jgi:SAM-dependent methyltransferase
MIAKNTLKVKIQSDGRAMLNLACGSRMHSDWNNIDFSPLSWLVKHRRFVQLLKSLRLLSSNRFDRLKNIDREIIRWDLRKGIPFTEDTFDVVYHSHFLEHLHRHSALLLLRDCHRVLEKGGMIRVVVPDLELRCRKYLNSLQVCEQKIDPDALEKHKENVQRLIGQLVIAEAAGTSEQKYLLKKIERFMRGTTDKTGDIHQWMYDKITLRSILKEAGFLDIRTESEKTSRIPDWPKFALDVNKDGSAYKHDSIYLEATK